MTRKVLPVPTALFVVRPAHNPLGLLDFDGAYDLPLPGSPVSEADGIVVTAEFEVRFEMKRDAAAERQGERHRVGIVGLVRLGLREPGLEQRERIAGDQRVDARRRRAK